MVSVAAAVVVVSVAVVACWSAGVTQHQHWQDPEAKLPRQLGETNNAKRRMAIVVFYNIVAIVVVAVVVATVVAVGVFCHCVLSPVLAASYCHRLRFA